MKVIIFDMDGTLINSAKAIYYTINALRRNIGLKENLKEDFIIKTINDPKKDMIFEFYGVRNVTKEQKYEFEREFIKNYKLHAKLYDGLFEILQKCRDEGYFLLKKPNEITFGDIFSATEGELVMTNLDIKNENLKRFFDDLNNKIKKTLEIPLSDYEKFIQTKEKFLNFVI